MKLLIPIFLTLFLASCGGNPRPLEDFISDPDILQTFPPAVQIVLILKLPITILIGATAWWIFDRATK